MHEHVQDEVSRALGKRLLDHPFYQRWSAGELSRDELRAYAAQYRHVEAAVPDILRRIAVGFDDPVIRARVISTLTDEVGGGDVPSHLELFNRFAAALDAAPAPPAPATARLVGLLQELADRSAIEGVAGLVAYELQSPQVSATKAAGLRGWYGLEDGAVEFWDVHATADVDHATWLVEALAGADADSALITQATASASEAWWSFLDEREAARP
jgi:pyrroloquinoline-quinone synthase